MSTTCSSIKDQHISSLSGNRYSKHLGKARNAGHNRPAHLTVIRQTWVHLCSGCIVLAEGLPIALMEK